MNRIEKNIIGFSKDKRFEHHLKSSKELLEIQLNKVTEIERCNNVKMPKFVKDGLIDSFATDKNKKAFVKADNLRYKPAKWLYENKVISIISVYGNGKPATFRIENMSEDWTDYETYKIEMDKKTSKIIERTFKNGMSIFN